VQILEVAQERLIAKITGLEDEVQKFMFAPEMKSEPVMPIRRDKALATLTDTEIMVLEMLLTEGPKTAPEIKERISLSREHTARLMKKLYEEGYLERETGKIPFRYSAKEEMGKFLGKPESQQT
jgi:predicted HTH transcriptional regulator